ncbi:ABC transporter substrate-binding protein [Paenibacillus lentus]|uniref:ABC transporter substrate-binding protein n=1 Tax=Paenibacillus lentus TaxID=1338368 RepID=A0A3S8RY86_9BACL|nr:ABC transporter substrate-binding protein [Paenibacillus lentus]AZK47875.1 ABC transporter substrate-binding protein [Paenibacillus lentus]
MNLIRLTKVWNVMIIILAAAIICGCSKQAESSGLTKQAANSAMNPDKPMRIAALSLDAAEAVLELTDPLRVAVLTRSAADPDLAFNADKVSEEIIQIAGATSLDPEKIMSYNADLLIMTKGHEQEKEAAQILEQAGVPLISLDIWDTFEKMEANYHVLGQALGEEETAEQITFEINNKLEAAHQAVAGKEQPSVLVISPVGPGTGPFLIGSSNISYDIVSHAGGNHLADELSLTRSAKASMEALLKTDPDYIILLQWRLGDDSDLEELTEAAGWSTLTAVQSNRVHTMSVKQLLYPNRYNADTVIELARLFHPDAF